MDFEAILQLESISDESKKTYMYGYKKLSTLLKKPVETATEKKIVKTLTELEIPLNTKKVMLVSALKSFNFFDRKTIVLIAFLEVLKEKIAVETQAKLEALVLPTLKDLTDHHKVQYKNEDWVGFIITYLLLNYKFRNKDLQINITKDKKDTKDKTRNHIFITCTYIRIYINVYKTADTYGAKNIVLKSVKVVHALNQFIGNEVRKPLIQDDIGSNLGRFVMSHTYHKIGEAAYFKTYVSEMSKSGRVKEIAKAGLTRGTDMDTIVNSYLA